MIVVQLPPFDPSPRTRPGQWAQIREAQRRFVADDPAAGLVVQIDQDSATDLHPAKKAVVAERALSVAYGRGYTQSGAEVPRIAQAGRTLILDYGIGNRLTAPDNRSVQGFELCTEYCVAVLGRLTGPRQIELALPVPGVLRFVRYGWSDIPRTDLRTERAGPLGPFAICLHDDAMTAGFNCR